jgi:hypothetical protein
LHPVKAFVHANDWLLVVPAEARNPISTWREHWTLTENATSLERAGMLPRRVVGKTCISRPETERGHEIDAWLKSVPFPVESFLILDDKDDMAMHRQRLVRVDSKLGMGSKEAEQAVKILTLTRRPAKA